MCFQSQVGADGAVDQRGTVVSDAGAGGFTPAAESLQRLRIMIRVLVSIRHVGNGLRVVRLPLVNQVVGDCAAEAIAMQECVAAQPKGVGDPNPLDQSPESAL